MKLEHIDSKADPRRGQLVALYQRMVCKVCILKAPTLIREAKTSSEVTVVGEARPAAEAVSNLRVRVSLVLKISQIDTTGTRVEFLKSF